MASVCLTLGSPHQYSVAAHHPPGGVLWAHFPNECEAWPPGQHCFLCTLSLGAKSAEASRHPPHSRAGQPRLGTQSPGLPGSRSSCLASGAGQGRLLDLPPGEVRRCCETCWAPRPVPGDRRRFVICLQHALLFTVTPPGAFSS